MEVSVSNLMSLENMEPVIRCGYLIDVSVSGFLIQINRQDIMPKELKQSLNLDPLLGLNIALVIDPMELEIYGHITRTRYVGKGVFEVAVDFSLDAPEYWRECLFDLLPGKDDSIYLYDDYESDDGF